MIEPRLDEVIGPVIDHLGEPLADSSAIPDLVRLARGAASRDGGAQRRRRRRELGPATTSDTCRTRSKPRRAAMDARAPGTGGRLAGRAMAAVAAIAASRFAPARCSRISAAIRPARTTRTWRF